MATVFSKLSSAIDRRDPRQPDHPLTSLPTTIMATTFFVIIWSKLKQHVARSGPVPHAKAIVLFNSRIYSVFSLILGLAVARDLFLDSSTFQELGKSAPAYVYYFSKMYEYIDVLLLVADGVSIGKHMAFHHLTTPFLTYFRVLHASQWQVFTLLNCLHHFLLYGYLGGVTVLRPVLFYTGYIQLIAGIALDAWYFFQNGTSDADESSGRAVGALLLLRYFQLYTDENLHPELRTGSQQEKKKKKKKKEKEVTTTPAESKKAR